MSASTVDEPSVSTVGPSAPKGLNFFPFPILWFSIVALEVSLLADLRIADADIWFHLRNARELFSRHSFLNADLYTFSAAGTPLLNYEWLSELPYYLAFEKWGQQGLLGVYLALLLMIFAGVYYLALRRGANCGEAGLVTMAGVALGCYSFGPRMMHFGWLCLVALMLVLEYFEATGRGLWLLPPIFALWVNLHGSWPVGFIILGIYGVSGMLEGQWSNVAAERWTSAQFRKLLGFSFASIVALFANPYGYKLVLYPFRAYMIYRQSATLDNVLEWRSVDFHTGWGKLALCMIFAVLAASWFSGKRWSVREVLLVLFALTSALTHLRFLLFAAIILVPILAPRLKLFAPYDPTKDKPWLNLAMSVGIAGMILWTFPSAAQLQENIDSQFPRDALRFMQQQQMNGRLFNYYDFGGYIEWNAPTVKPFADGRADIFVYTGVLDDYLKINQIDQPLELLDKYNIDYVMFPVDKHLTYVLDHSAGWRSVYEDKVVKVFRRVPAAATTLDLHPS
jgi:hypothetical protein